MTAGPSRTEKWETRVAIAVWLIVSTFIVAWCWGFLHVGFGR